MLIDQSQPHPEGHTTRVSVVVPSYNHAPFVQAALRSIFRQSLQPHELLVIDDGSTDDSPQIIERALHECPFACELIVRGNRGLCATLNEGLARTSGDYFAYLGSDDLWLPEFLAARVRTLNERTHAVLAYGHAFLIDKQERIIDCTADWANYTDGDARTMLLAKTIAPMSPTVLYRRNALEQFGWNEQAALEDYELYLKLSSVGEFAFDAQVLSAWRQHGHNASRNFVWMIEARLGAQRAAAAGLGISGEELAKYQRILKFSGAEDLLRLGDKNNSLTYLRAGWTSGSVAARLRMLTRLLIPNALFNWRRRRKQKDAAVRYGSLPL